MNVDDLLSFKEFEPVHDSYARGGSAEININSPKRNYTLENDDNLGNLVNNMQTSVNILQNEENNMQQNTETAPTGTKYQNASFFSIEYYQQFFDVDTTVVVDRIVYSMIPRRAPASYLKQHIGLNPDLYGPFWIVVTLIFSIAISGNVASYLQHTDNTEFHWRYNFHLVSIAATTIVMYVCFVPLTLWGAFKWFVQEEDANSLESEAPFTPSLLTLICIYGYSLVIYIPVSILWVIQLSFLQWFLAISATFLSGSVLILVLSPALRVSKGSLIMAIGIIGAHFLLAAGFMLYFFHVPDVVTKVTQIVTEAAAVVPPLNKTQQLK